MAFQTTLFRYLKKTAASSEDLSPSESLVPKTSSAVAPKEVVKEIVQNGPPYPDIGRLQPTELSQDDLKYRLVTESWDSGAKYKFPSR